MNNYILKGLQVLAGLNESVVPRGQVFVACTTLGLPQQCLGCHPRKLGYPVLRQERAVDESRTL